MKIQSISIKNFRRFEKADFRFNERFTVLIGDNATGKSAILDALAILTGSYLLDFKSATKRAIKASEVRKKVIFSGEVHSLEQQFPVSLSCSALVYAEHDVNLDVPMQWSRELQGVNKKTSRLNAGKIIKRGREDAKRMQDDDEVILPLMAYYGTGRLWHKKKDMGSTKLESRDVGYKDCLDPQSNHKLFEKWFRKLEMAALQKKMTYDIVDAVRTVVKQCIPGCEDFYFDMERVELVVDLEGQGLTTFEDLSDGYRNMLAIVADIAHRAARLNPQLGVDVAKEIRGVVLIDEIDLHLHPKWQRIVVDNLKAAFPKLQFVASTHSPFIVQSLQPGEVIDLNASSASDMDSTFASPSPTSEYINRSIEDIVEDVMGVELPSRSARLQKMFDAATDYYKLLEDSKQENTIHSVNKTSLKRKLDELSAPFSEDVAFHAFLNLERLAAEFDSEDDSDETR